MDKVERTDAEWRELLGRLVSREENPSPDTDAVVVIASSTQEAIVVNVPSL